MSILLKSTNDSLSDSHLNEDLTVKGGQLSLLQRLITNTRIDFSFYDLYGCIT